jgi:5-methylcytosine-specific restriction protein A
MMALRTSRPLLATHDTRRLKPPPKRADPVYLSPEWRTFIAKLIKARGRVCEHPQCRTPNRGAGQRIFGDHTKELVDGGGLLDPDNVMLMCSPCHGIKTASERARRAAQR